MRTMKNNIELRRGTETLEELEESDTERKSD
jgi:hypothetical protein